MIADQESKRITWMTAVADANDASDVLERMKRQCAGHEFLIDASRALQLAQDRADLAYQAYAKTL